MKQSITAEIRKTFIAVLVVSMLAALLTYGGGWFLFLKLLERDAIYPANRDENKAIRLEEEIKGREDIFSPEGERFLQKATEDSGVGYQAVDVRGNILFGSPNRIFSPGEEFQNSLNTLTRRGDRYYRTVPVFSSDGEFRGGLILSYGIKPGSETPGGRFFLFLLPLAFLIPFFYITLFTFLFSKRLGAEINRPLKMLTKASEKIKARDLDFTIDYYEENELGELADSFREMKAELETSLFRQWKMEEERREMIDALTHDLKSPLSVIKVYAEALFGSAESEKERRYLTVIRENTEKCIRMAETMKLTEEEIPKEEVTSFSLRDFLEKKREEYERRGEEKRISVDVRYENIPEEISTERASLERILDNLFSNSLEMTPPGGKITLDGEERDGFVIYRVSDTGPGFSAEDLKKGRQRFYRGDKSRETKGGHWGLGLFTADTLVRHLGGTMTLKNNSEGAVVEFSHPKKL